MAYIRQTRPDSGRGFHAKVRTTFQGVRFWLGSGLPGRKEAFIQQWASEFCHLSCLGLGGGSQFKAKQLLSSNVERFRAGLVFKAVRSLYHSTLGSRVVKKKKRDGGSGDVRIV